MGNFHVITALRFTGIGYYYHHLSTTDTWIKNLNIVGVKDNQMSCDVIKTNFCYLSIENFQF